jgi:hypothetical protein
MAAQFQLLFVSLSQRTKKFAGNLRQNSRPSGRDLNWGSCEYEGMIIITGLVSSMCRRVDCSFYSS